MVINPHRVIVVSTFAAPKKKKNHPHVCRLLSVNCSACTVMLWRHVKLLGSAVHMSSTRGSSTFRCIKLVEHHRFSFKANNRVWRRKMVLCHLCTCCTITTVICTCQLPGKDMRSKNTECGCTTLSTFTLPVTANLHNKDTANICSCPLTYNVFSTLSTSPSLRLSLSPSLTLFPVSLFFPSFL